MGAGQARNLLMDLDEREPKRLCLRLFAVAARLASSGRRLRLHLAECWPWAADITAAVTRLQAISSG